ncbi:MAG: hypothetical protein K0A95_08315 [Chromatiales bacterium]|nr:hypothetical protein [Gammaproteobacteria bacterium]MBW6477061.1 hypothetical protein [Chromatiales bacterium]
MQVNNAFNTAIQGINRGMDGLNRNAASIAQASTGEGGDVVQPLVESKINKLQVEANVRMLQAQDQMIGSLLDEMA